MDEQETLTMGRRSFIGGGAAGLMAGTMTGSVAGAAIPGAETPDLVVHGAKVTTLDPERADATAIAVRRGVVTAVGNDGAILRLAGPGTIRIDAGGRRLIPGINDSHMHPIRGGLNYNMELRWDGVPTLADAMAMLRRQAQVTPPPQWVRVVGGFSLLQWPERRLPTLDEINRAAPDTPVFILHLYDRALLNAAALRAVGYDRNTPDPPGGEIQRDARGNPTGLLVAKPNAQILYATLAKGPKLSEEDQLNSTRHMMRELNRLGITSAIDAGGGFQNYPDDYKIIEKLAKDDLLTVRLSYHLFPQRAGKELEDFGRWAGSVRPGSGSDMYRLNGAGEMLTYSAADFEDFRQPRPDMPPRMEGELEAVVRFLAERRWPFRFHATYEETISRALDVFERVHSDGLLQNTPRWFLDHAETISPRSMDRVRALGGGIAVQHRMALQGGMFVERYGPAAAAETPPVKAMLERGIPVGMGSDATRVSTYDPWLGLHWLISGEDVSGTALTRPGRRLDRRTALELYTRGSAWFSGEQHVKGRLAPGMLADMALLDADYFTVPEPEIRNIQSVLTIVGGRIVHGSGTYARLAPALPPASPSWSPVTPEGGVYRAKAEDFRAAALVSAACGCGSACAVHGHKHHATARAPVGAEDTSAFWGALGCNCWI
jgi:predicted amidohydrolase YtcJ